MRVSLFTIVIKKTRALFMRYTRACSVAVAPPSHPAAVSAKCANSGHAEIPNDCSDLTDGFLLYGWTAIMAHPGVTLNHHTVVTTRAFVSLNSVSIIATSLPAPDAQ